MSIKQVRAPMPGTFYRSSGPDQPPFKADGDTVTSADTIGLIEVMKTFHTVAAGVDGKALRFLVDNEDPVMAGQVIAEVDE
ncbi:acetyl-CoA carboxylase [Rhodopseudomonas palustris]|uniref:Biotin carboxyl carrier protein of acetyl-CoA carboxylase n=1 Tax=Labrys monachus TaxID=217067 RepID=A0ABU0F8A5_9HYPH|nr:MULTISPECIES: acetyl-CoA carboxylase [Hyphomicrobiales]MDQ0390374.1 biotin carboxyl carrier protein [Labrys monachus]WQG97847.1 acetyl-CoA carboxylase [Rhodopseudomonas palustris]